MIGSEEWDLQQKVKKQNPDLPYREVIELAKTELNKKANELIKKHIDASTKYLKQHKKELIKNLRTPDKGSVLGGMKFLCME